MEHAAGVGKRFVDERGHVGGVTRGKSCDKCNVVVTGNTVGDTAHEPMNDGSRVRAKPNEVSQAEHSIRPGFDNNERV
jgi:hypothetical protein